MFGFLKQKISDFGNKLKKTILKEEEKIKSVESKETSLEETTPKIVGSTPKKISGVQSKEVEQKLIKETKKEVKTKKNKEPQKATPLKETNSPSTSKTPQISGEEKTPPKRTFFDKLFKRKTLEEENTPSKELKLEEENVKEKILKPTLTPKIESKKIEPKISGKPKKVVKEETLKEKELDEIEELLKEDEEPTPQEATLTQKKRGVEVLRVNEDKRELKAKIDVGSGLKGFLFGGVEITEKQIEELLFELELSLLESDVELEATT